MTFKAWLKLQKNETTRSVTSPETCLKTAHGHTSTSTRGGTHEVVVRVPFYLGCQIDEELFRCSRTRLKR
jgi:hypothetical protein